MARAICRRAERRVSPLVRDGMADMSCAVYLNRYADMCVHAVCLRIGAIIIINVIIITCDIPPCLFQSQRLFVHGRSVLELEGGKARGDLPQADAAGDK